jgi:site-specific recombinase XerD
MPTRRTKRHPGTLVSRGKSTRVILYAGGVRHSYTLHTSDRREAVEFARVKHQELERQLARVRRGLPGRLPFSALLDRYTASELPHLAPNTQKTYAASIESFRRYFVEERGDPTAQDVTALQVSEYLAWRRRHHGRGEKYGAVGSRTIAKDRACLHAIFSHAVALELREGNPVSRVKAPESDPREPVILTEKQYQSLLDACQGRPMLWLYVLTLAETGVRCDSEALRLRWEDIDLEHGYLWIASGRDQHRTKSGKGRWVPMTATLHQAMRQHFASLRFATYTGQPSPWIFHHLTTRRRARAGDRIRTLRRGFEHAVTRAKLPAELHQHDLRHRRATTWLASGGDVVKVKEAMGHSDLRTTMGYTHLVREHLRSLVEPTPNLSKNLTNGEAQAS